MSTSDPTHAQPVPPFPEQEQEPPGREADMRPLADHGEDSYEGTGRLRDRVALITGADSGIGRAVAIAFAREGADVLCSYLSEDEDAGETRRLVEAAGRRCLTVAGDIGDRDHCRSLVERAVDELGRLDVLVNNAAYQMAYDSFLEIPPDEIDFVFRTNVLSMFHLCQAAVPHMEPGSRLLPHQRAFDVPPLPGRGAPHGARLDDHQHHLDPGGAAQPPAPALRDHEGRDQHLHQGARAGGRGAGDPRQRRRARADLDAAGDHEAPPATRTPSSAATPRSAGPASPGSSRRCTCSWPPTTRATSAARSSGRPEASRCTSRAG